MAIVPLLGGQSVPMDSDTILVWNICGLNSRTRHTAVVDMVVQECISLIGLQETKLSVADDSLVINICGMGFEYSFLLAVGTRGALWSHGAPLHGQRHKRMCPRTPFPYG
jgi:hypothetical protein